VPSETDPVLAQLLSLLTPLELLRIATMPEAARLSSASEDTLEREHRDKIVHVSRRRRGMRVVHALMLREGRDFPRGRAVAGGRGGSCTARQKHRPAVRAAGRTNLEANL
jgi:hypothetical protein